MEENGLFTRYLGKVEQQKCMGSTKAIDAQPFENNQPSKCDGVLSMRCRLGHDIIICPGATSHDGQCPHYNINLI